MAINFRRRRRLERRLRRQFGEDLQFGRVRRSNRKRALFGVLKRGKLKMLEKAPNDRTIIDVNEILKKNCNGM